MSSLCISELPSIFGREKSLQVDESYCSIFYSEQNLHELFHSSQNLSNSNWFVIVLSKKYIHFSLEAFSENMKQTMKCLCSRLQAGALQD